jgi:hypothetical protein
MVPIFTFKVFMLQKVYITDFFRPFAAGPKVPQDFCILNLPSLHLLRPVPEFIDPVFAKTSPKRSFLGL